MSCTLLRAAVLSIAVAFLVTPGKCRAQPGAATRADLALVPGDAVAFAHIRVADLWRTEPFKDLRILVDRAGPKAFETYNRRFPVNPSIIDRVTVFVLPGPPDAPQHMPPPVFVIATNKPVDAVKLIANYMPGAKAVNLNGLSVFTDADRDMTLYPVDPQTFVFSTPEAVKAFVSRKGKVSDGTFLPVIAAAGSKHITVGMNASAVPPDAIAQIPPPFQPLVQAKLATLTVDVGTEAAFELRLRYADEAAATAAEKSARAGVQLARAKMQEAKREIGQPLFDPPTPPPSPLSEMPPALGSLFGLAMIGTYDELLDKFPLSRDGTQLVVQAKVPAQSVPTIPLAFAAAGWIGFARHSMAFDAARAEAIHAQPPIPAPPPPPPPPPAPPVGRIFESKEARAINNMKQIGIAMHNYHDATGTFPGQAIYSKDGKTPLLSWRVAILPYLEQDAVYRQFKLDEPWDSEHNLKLLKTHQIPPYMNPNAPPAKETGLTHFKLFVGGGAGWDRGLRGARIQTITDGTSNTIMVVEAADATPWTKPDDIEYDPKKPLPKLGANPESTNFLVLMMDGAVYKKSKTLGEAVLRAAITRAGGELLEW